LDNDDNAIVFDEIDAGIQIIIGSDTDNFVENNRYQGAIFLVLEQLLIPYQKNISNGI
jgi:hypothetical protein